MFKTLLWLHKKVNKQVVYFFVKIKTSRKVEMEGFEDRFVSHIDYKGLAGTSVTLFEAVSL